MNKKKIIIPTPNNAQPQRQYKSLLERYTDDRQLTTMPTPARPTARRSGNSKIKLRLDVALAAFVVLIVTVQFSLHSSVSRTSDINNVNNNANVADADTGSGNVKPLRINAPKSSSSASSSSSSFPPHYTTFSTACSASQNWQSFMFFYFAAKVSQPGQVIRIASGCSDEQKAELIKFQETHISKLSPHFKVHFTPDFSNVSGDNYKYYNKPFGLQHWLEHGLRYNEDKANEDAIVMILDPDMILLRPLTYDFTDSNVMIHKSARGPPKMKKVTHGHPWASLYGFGDGPFRLDNNYIFQNWTDSNALKVTRDEIVNNYPGGPPYMATGRDMYAIVNAWCMLVPRVHHVYPGLLGEMYGWSLGAAHINLPHTLAESFMVSNTDMSNGEGWALIDQLADDDVCRYSPDSKELEDQLPYTLHFCQNYWLGKWFIGKYRLDSDFLSCSTSLLMEPPDNLAKLYDFYIQPGGKPYGKKVPVRPAVAKRDAFMICQLIKRFNDAATWYKQQACEEGEGNYEKSWIFHHHLDVDNNEGGEKTAKW